MCHEKIINIIQQMLFKVAIKYPNHENSKINQISSNFFVVDIEY